MRDEEELKRKFLELILNDSSPQTYTMWTDPPKKDSGYHSLTDELKELMRDWLSSSKFAEHITIAERLLIHEYLRSGEYNEDGKEVLNMIRKKWIKYLEENKLR